jgi:hypothetical protein
MGFETHSPTVVIKLNKIFEKVAKWVFANILSTEELLADPET